MYPLVREATKSTFDNIAAHVDDNFICAGSFPAAHLAAIWSSETNNGVDLKLRFNDIDVYHVELGEGNIQRRSCSWTKLDAVDSEINLISCSNLNVKSLIENYDINA